MSIFDGFAIVFGVYNCPHIKVCGPYTDKGVCVGGSITERERRCFTRKHERCNEYLDLFLESPDDAHAPD
jgi:hypothetical protein